MFETDENEGKAVMRNGLCSVFTPPWWQEWGNALTLVVSTSDAHKIVYPEGVCVFLPLAYGGDSPNCGFKSGKGHRKGDSVKFLGEDILIDKSCMQASSAHRPWYFRTENPRSVPFV